MENFDSKFYEMLFSRRENNSQMVSPIANNNAINKNENISPYRPNPHSMYAYQNVSPAQRNNSRVGGVNQNTSPAQNSNNMNGNSYVSPAQNSNNMNGNSYVSPAQNSNNMNGNSYVSPAQNSNNMNGNSYVSPAQNSNNMNGNSYVSPAQNSNNMNGNSYVSPAQNFNNMNGNSYVSPAQNSNNTNVAGMYNKILSEANDYKNKVAGTNKKAKGLFQPKTAFPADTPVGMAYVPYQMWETPYDDVVGFVRGTIFPSLDKPFIGEEAVSNAKQR